MAKIEIKHSNTGEYYELYINGDLMGTYDTATEAAIECDEILGLEAATE